MARPEQCVNTAGPLTNLHLRCFMAIADLTAAQVREVLDYDPETGNLIWRVRTGYRIKAGDIAGCKNNRGYVLIHTAGKNRPAHRLVWLHVYGEWPDGVIDHINGNKGDNRIAHLRVVAYAANAQNQREPSKSNKCGWLGVYKRNKRWAAVVRLSGVSHYLGRFDTPEAAHAAYIEAKRRLHKGCTL